MAIILIFSTLYIVRAFSLYIRRAGNRFFMIRSRIFATLWLLLLLGVVTAQKMSHVASVREVTDTYFGEKVTDPYRWMENLKDPEVLAWMKAQNDYTRTTLDRIPGHQELLARVQQLNSAGAKVRSLQRAGDRFFYLKSPAGSNIPKLYVRDTLEAPERLLVDTEKISSADKHYSIDFYKASFDGRFVAYGISPSGSEDTVLHLIDSTTGRELDEQIEGLRFWEVSWRPDNRSFYYNKLNKLAPGEPPEHRFLRSRIYLHFLGTKPVADQAIFGCGVSSQISCVKTDIPDVFVTPAAPQYVFVAVNHGAQSELTGYVTAERAINGSKTPWRKVFDTEDEVTAFDVHSDDLYLLTFRDAPRYKVTRLSLADTDLSNAEVVVPPSQSVVTGISAAQDGLYVQQLDGGIGKLLRVPFKNGAKSQQITLPFDGAISELITDPHEDGAFIRLTSWTKSPRYYRYDPKVEKTFDTKLIPPSPVEFSQIESLEVKAKSADGTLIPLSIVHQRGIALDASHPTILEGYGAYGFNMDPTFDPKLLAWLERGGVYAAAHVRGGGEYGEEWHQAGMKLAKQNSISDFVACAQYLIEHKFTKPSLLSAVGGSGGGIILGGVITQRPDLFSAIVCDSCVFNMLRFETEANGLVNTPEFGSVSTPDGYKALYAMDSYVHVTDRTSYPAVMLSVGTADPRVALWQSLKMAARLQAATSSGKPVLLRVDYDSGHGGSTNTQLARFAADQYAFLFWQFGVADHLSWKDKPR